MPHEKGQTGPVGSMAGSALPLLVGFDAAERTLTIRMPGSILDQGYVLGAEILIGEPGWTVLASDYDRCKDALQLCRDTLSIHRLMIPEKSCDEALDAADAILSPPNTSICLTRDNEKR